MVAREPSPPETIERSTNEDYWPGRTITDHLNRAARRAPDKLAVIDSRREITLRRAQVRDRLARDRQPGSGSASSPATWSRFGPGATSRCPWPDLRAPR